MIQLTLFIAVCSDSNNFETDYILRRLNVEQNIHYMFCGIFSRNNVMLFFRFVLHKLFPFETLSRPTFFQRYRRHSKIDFLINRITKIQ